MTSSRYKQFFDLTLEQEAKHSSVFGEIDPAESYDLLTRSGKKWLLRESHQQGMLTVDFLSDDAQNIYSVRFALIGFQGQYQWQIIEGAKVKAAKAHCIPLTHENINSNEHVSGLFHLLTAYGYTIDTLLKSPKRSASHAYDNYQPDENLLKDNQPGIP